MLRDELEHYLDELLKCSAFRDYCPNGLQVEGRDHVAVIATAVTASAAVIEAALEVRADALLVHHGYFWKGDDPRLTGTRRRRVALLLAHGLNLFAYHLPLDAHPELGNNAMLAARIGLTIDGRFGDQFIAAHGHLTEPVSAGELSTLLETRLERPPLLIGDRARTVQRVAWCTGAAQGYFEEAIRLGVDAYISGEVSEQTYHLACETGVAFLGAGHHATERYGIQALGEHLAQRCGVQHRHIDIPNPV